jgi:hypothetical protein
MNGVSKFNLNHLLIGFGVEHLLIALGGFLAVFDQEYCRYFKKIYDHWAACMKKLPLIIFAILVVFLVIGLSLKPKEIPSPFIWWTCSRNNLNFAY